MKIKKDKFFKASKAASILITVMLIVVTFSVINVETTDVTNNNAPADWTKASDTYQLVMNFTITTTSDELLAGVSPSEGQILSSDDLMHYQKIQVKKS